ncbi:MAG: DNA-binding response regulator, OmpR family, contains REC and winged-helix (WHTH) domain [uncultured Sulfurovum sp.]|uniref:DNA-binding response regulator, OmpR family, contains REC and winged-helix (WHTH) domain n=1 Tax=uncultured Sulfurovum sp. TaxID=269237 RepID=A0A6S6SFP3_9BACT|nr:MAG: DNA-binding response regulator, OmpR family, contains REC and winged-helix (WHTH) domain [uncultured Sulfurovum sp.]
MYLKLLKMEMKMTKYNILIVEDEFINAHFVEQTILNLGHNVVALIETAQEAINICQKKEVHIVFMDINLQGNIDGIECAKRLNKTQDIPIIYTTAFSDSKTIDEATDTNLFGYLIKPFDHQDIEASLNIAIKRNYLKKAITKNTNSQLFTNLSHNYRYYDKTQTLIKHEDHIMFTNKESEVFYCLFKNINQTVTSTYLINHVWKAKAISSSTIRDTILRLRKKVPELEIKTISGIGYSLNDSI